MTRVHQGAGVLIIAFSIWVMVEAHKMTYMTAIGPGPGFFPFWLAVMMTVLSVIWLAQLTLRPLPGKAIAFVPSRAGLVRIASLLISTALVVLLLERIGFSVMMFVFMMFLLIGLGRQNLILTLVMALVCSFGLYWVFTGYLDVQFPKSAIPFLRDLGF